MTRPTTGAKMYNRNPLVPEPLEVRKLLAAGEYLDSFGSEGVVETPVAGRFESIHVLPNGKILAGGFADSPDGGDLLLARFNANGTTDSTFGTNGVTTFDFFEGDSIVNLFTDSIGRIFAATSNSATVRFTASGRLDTRFGGGDGVLPNNPVAAVLGDGRFLTVSNDLLKRFTPNGGTDATFGTDGAVSTLVLTGAVRRIGPAQLQITNEGYVLLATNMLIVGGDTPTERNVVGVVTRFNSNGSINQAFGPNGNGSLAFGKQPFSGSPSATYSAPAIALDQAGRLVVLSAQGLERFDKDGDDRTVLNASASNAEKIFVDSKGRIVGFAQFRLFQRWLADGALDVRFAGDGATSGQVGLDGSPTLAAITPVGDDLLVGGNFDLNSSSGTDFFAASLFKISGANPTTPAYRYEPGAILLINGTEQSDRIRVFGEGDTITVTVGSTTQSFSADDVQDIVIYGYGGNDDIEAGVSFIDCVAYGGTGNDLINLRRFRRASAFAEGGNDTVKIFAKNDAFGSGGAGNDSIEIDLFSGNSRAAQASGGDGNDLLIGGRQKDSFNGDAGDDTLRGMGGQDRLFGNSGNDMLQGGDNFDGLWGGSGNDTLTGDGGDGLNGGAGDDFYDCRNGRSDFITEVGGTFYGNDRAIVDRDKDIYSSDVEVVLFG